MVIDRQLDGMDLSRMITSNQGPYRQDIETINQVSTIIHESYKLMNFPNVQLGVVNGWLGTNDDADRESSTYVSRVLNSKVAINLRTVSNPLDPARINEIRSGLRISCNDQREIACGINSRTCLFNILEDPCEMRNLANEPEYANTLKDMQSRLDIAMTRVVPSRNAPAGKK